ncbi:putative reverse transcriptase domain-containing protein [Tanacetum coccineum]
MDGQSERVIWTLEGMLRAYVIDFDGSWDVHLLLVEFSYNNSYHTSTRCAPFKALYGRKCRSPVLWAKIGEGSLIGPELVQETTDKVVVIKVKAPSVACRDLEAAFEYPGGSPAGIHGLFSGWYCGLAGRKVTLGVSMAWAKGVTTGTLVTILRMLKLGRVASETVGLHAESFS